MKPLNEKTLVHAAKTGDRKAFGRLYDALFPRVYAYVYARLSTPQDAEDIVSLVFERVITGLKDFEWRREGSFAAWIFQIARHQVADFYRNAPGRVETESLAPDTNDGQPPPEAVLVQEERVAQIHQLIHRLSPRRQEIIRLRYFAQLRNNEIARLLELDERTVASHLSRALADLKAGLEADKIEASVKKVEQT